MGTDGRTWVAASLFIRADPCPSVVKILPVVRSAIPTRRDTRLTPLRVLSPHDQVRSGAIGLERLQRSLRRHGGEVQNFKDPIHSTPSPLQAPDPHIPLSLREGVSY